MTGAFDLPIAPSKYSTEEIVREAHRLRCAGGGRSQRIDRSKGRSSPTSEDDRRSGMEESVVEVPRLSSKQKSIKDQMYTVRGVYHLTREAQSPVEIPQKVLKPSGPRQKQESQGSTQGRCNHDVKTLSTRVDCKLSDAGPEMRTSISTTCNTSAAANSLSISSSTSFDKSEMGSIARKKPVAKSTHCGESPNKDKKRTSPEGQESVARSDVSSPDLSIFKSSRARLALKKNNKNCTMKMKPSSAFGATCWTASSCSHMASADGSLR